MITPTPPDTPPDPLTDDQLAAYGAQYGWTGPPAPAGGGFGVDTDVVPSVITRLDGVIDRFTETMWQLHQLSVRPPGGDHVSARIASNTNLMLRNAHEYLRVLRERTIAARQALAAQTAAYQDADDPNRFTP
jgi:hypothetical protein